MNTIIFGPPGAGKGTQANLLINKYNLTHLSTGDILRNEITAGTKLGLEAKNLMDAGNLVPDEVVIGMIASKLDNSPRSNGFIFDGFPRTAAQAEALDVFLHCKKMSIRATIALEVDEEVLVNRLLSRGKDSGRSDDQDENKIRNRFAEYNKKTAPLIDYYKSQNKFYSIRGEGTVAKISKQLTSLLHSL